MEKKMKVCWIKVAVFPGLKNAVHIDAVSWGQQNWGKNRLHTRFELSLKHVRYKLATQRQKI